MKEAEFVCTKCPMGCMLNLTIIDGEITVSGNNCKLGEKYGKSEYTNPVRILTTSIRIETKDGVKILSVKTNNDIPKNKVFDCLEEVKKISILKDKIDIGEVIINNILDLGVDIVATRNIS